MEYGFKLNSDLREEVSLEDFKGKKLVLYFYPKDNTKGCTIEAEGFRDLYEEFQKYNTEIVGLSRDTVRTHKNFKEKYNLPFELLSDPQREILGQYGLLKPGKMYGKDVIKTERSTFLFDENSNLIKEFRDVKPADHPEEVIEYIKSLD